MFADRYNEEHCLCAGATDAVPKQTKQLLTAEFSGLLAELGQVARSREVLKSLAGSINPATDAPAASALQAAQLKLQAWSALRMDGGQALWGNTWEIP